MPPQSLKAWVPENLISKMQHMVSKSHPLETGGIFVGYWANDLAVVVTNIIGPGPEAIHENDYFHPDHSWQLDHLQDLYISSGRKHTYLGDWHSHPDASSGTLSWKDKRVLKRIALEKEARAPKPIMGILYGEKGLYGEKENFRITLWLGTIKPFFSSFKWLSIREAQIVLYK